MSKRLIAGLLAAFVAVGLLLATAAPAQAAGKGEIPGTPANTNLVQTKEVVDDGGQIFVIKFTWGNTYETNAEDIRVTLHSLSINAKGVNLDEQGIDGRVRVYDGYKSGATTKIQDVAFDGADDPFNLNPKNPLNRPGITKVVISGVGVDGDGKGGADTEVFLQPTVGSKIV